MVKVHVVEKLAHLIVAGLGAVNISLYMQIYIYKAASRSSVYSLTRTENNKCIQTDMQT